MRDDIDPFYESRNTYYQTSYKEVVIVKNITEWWCNQLDHNTYALSILTYLQCGLCTEVIFVKGWSVRGDHYVRCLL